ncbi:MAG TPA: hypothetical protein VMU75_06385 [Acidimicrobiales bacterium]|nr:hypothetical protein [Acidimicrobiales bacterium]
MRIALTRPAPGNPPAGRAAGPLRRRALGLAAFLATGLALAACSTSVAAPGQRARAPRTSPGTNSSSSGTALGGATSTTRGPATSTTTTLAPGPGIVKGHVTAIGDSVMVDYEADLQAAIPGIDVEAAVSRQWSAGIAEAEQLRAEHRLGATVVIGLGTNGPITAADFDAMMSALAGVSKVVFVTVHVDQPWQDSVNAVLRAGVASHPGTVLADWTALADGNPGWLYSDGTHLPIGGTGAQALATLVASKIRGS